jgi:hypothetical protein
VAQPPSGERDISTFREKEAEMLALIGRQKPILANLENNLATVKYQLAYWDSVLRFRDNIPRFRDQALNDVAQLRQTNEAVYQQMLELNMQWFRFTRHLMAVYTRYGELLSGNPNRIDEHLKSFLQQHREIVFKMEELLLKVNDNLVMADFLLNTRLN